MKAVGDRLYFTGDFVWGDGKQLNNIAYWENGHYYDLGSGFVQGVDNLVCGGVYFAGGFFFTTSYYVNSNNQGISYLTKWTGTAWETVHECFPQEGFYNILEMNDKLYISGAHYDSISIKGLMIYDPASGKSFAQTNLLPESGIYNMILFQNRLYCFGSLKMTGNSNTYTAGYFKLPDIATATAPEIAAFSTLTLSPNPATETVTITTTDHYDAIEIYDISGKLQMRTTVQNEQRNTLNIANLSKGIYFVKTISADKEAVAKMLVQ